MTPDEQALKVMEEWAPHLDDGLRNARLQLHAIMAAAIREAVAREREACAKTAETCPYRECQMNDGARDDVAAAIRARGDA